ncbi:ABC transporter substrate-binding protein [Epibacterium ulvae]|uniref:MlaC/ttg2D family ABC transporter substrate-binding protein n=1 Tax=Epibacterium ulvae TaxID=1156985 RepID=UPI001BFC9EC0|nr:ABC transporter substrate-binding protein [Epibacterium ulvae]MBT8153831.1 ABC transporter substrate-binding protein [Epibacterium ulvae]
MDRRNFLLSLGASLSFAPAAAWALDNTSASRLIDNLVGDINNVIESGKGETAMFREFERIFANYSDTSYIAAYAMGVEARRASNSQKKAFSKAFQGYISRKYGRRFREFVGGRLEVTGVKKVKKWYEVDTVAYLQGQSPFKVTFLVSDRSGQDRFFNMFIEGVNLLLTERTEVGAILDRNRGDIDKTIAELKKLG